MKIKRVLLEPAATPGSASSLAVWQDGEWVVLKRLLAAVLAKPTPPYVTLVAVADDLISFIQERPVFEAMLQTLITQAREKNLDISSHGADLLPFKPLLYRDFMLCERHVVGSTRGFVKRLVPPLYGIARAWEALTRRTWPGFKPKPAWYRNPVYYKGNHLSFKADGEEITFPAWASWKDYELELGMIMTRPLCNATEAEAREAIGAFCVFNDFSVRNVQVEEMLGVGFGPCKAKDFASSLSAVVVTADEFWPALETRETRVFINDRLVASGRLDGFYHSLAKAVAYASKGEKVYPGEFMASGTIAGCCGMENGQLLEAGDLVRLEIDGIGSLSNRIAVALT